MSVLLLRHPQSLHNALGLWAGHIDSPLTAVGREEAVLAAKRLARKGYCWVVSSDLRRAYGSAGIISKLLGVPQLVGDARWRERNAGLWQGRIVSTLQEDSFYLEWAQNPMGDIPGGEGYDAFRFRLLGALQTALTYSFRAGPGIVVAHDGVQQCLAREIRIEGYPWPALDGPEIDRPF